MKIGFPFDMPRPDIWAFLPSSVNGDAKCEAGGYVGMGNAESGLKTQEKANNELYQQGGDVASEG